MSYEVAYLSFTRRSIDAISIEAAACGLCTLKHIGLRDPESPRGQTDGRVEPRVGLGRLCHYITLIGLNPVGGYLKFRFHLVKL